MKLNNQQIYKYATNLISFYTKQQMPVKINFFLQKNIKLIIESAQEIEKTRLEIAKNFGIYNKNNDSYSIPSKNIEIVQQEIQDLFSLEQELPIHIFKLEDFENIELTMEQLSAIMFMIEE